VSHYKEHTVDLHVQYEESYYDGASSIAVQVIYPSMLHGPITVEYEGERAPDVCEEVGKDIAAFIETPVAWVRAYVSERSTDSRRKLLEAERDLAEYRSELAEYERYVSRYQGHVQETQQNIARLKAQIEAEEAQ
jgi:hypothetical protein